MSSLWLINKVRNYEHPVAINTYKPFFISHRTYYFRPYLETHFLMPPFDSRPIFTRSHVVGTPTIVCNNCKGTLYSQNSWHICRKCQKRRKKMESSKNCFEQTSPRSSFCHRRRCCLFPQLKKRRSEASKI